VITDKLLEKAIRQNSAPLAEALEKALDKEDKGPLTGLLIANLTEKGTKFTEEEIPLLMDALKGESSHEVQSLLLEHLERIDAPDEKLEGYLSYLRESPTPTHASEVVEQLASSKSPRAVDGLVEILDEGELPRGRRQIMEALGKMGDPSAVDSLSRILQDPESKGDQAASLKALAAIGDRTALGAILGHAAQENNRYALQAIQEIDTRKHPDAVPVLGDALLERSYPAYQLAILRKLSRDGDQRVERSVQRAMDKMENRQVIAAAADSLSRFGSEKSMIYLQEKMMQTADPYTKKNLERAIRRISARIEKERSRR
jgi:HEAT repeat protein